MNENQPMNQTPTINKEINYTPFINRDTKEQHLRTLLTDFATLTNEEKLAAKKGIYVYGEPGIGKSYFVKRVLKEMNYEMVMYDTGMVRNKDLFDIISSNNMSNFSVLSMLKRQPKKIAIVMDDINSMNNGDKGSLSALIKIIRPKKTKKHKAEDTSMNPIICIGNGLTNVGKKITELIKICHVIELKRPNTAQIGNLLAFQYPSIHKAEIEKLTGYIQNDFNKLKIIMNMYTNHSDVLYNSVFQDIFHLNSNNDGNKKIVKQVFNSRNLKIEDHLSLIGETERTTVGLYWHENVPDIIERTNLSKPQQVDLYLQLLTSMCFADYMDRVTFQKQIWKFNEMSSLIKTFKTQYILHSHLTRESDKGSCCLDNNRVLYPWDKSNIRFTKILTKYSNEFNNFVFFQTIGEKMGLDRKDIYYFFMKLKTQTPMTKTNLVADNNPLSRENISCMDIKRIYKFISALCWKTQTEPSRSTAADLDLEYEEEYVEQMQHLEFEEDNETMDE